MDENIEETSPVDNSIKEGDVFEQTSGNSIGNKVVVERLIDVFTAFVKQLKNDGFSYRVSLKDLKRYYKKVV